MNNEINEFKNNLLDSIAELIKDLESLRSLVNLDDYEAVDDIRDKVIDSMEDLDSTLEDYLLDF